jgi:hypothetical protein
MSTKRQSIDSLRNKLRERNADSNYSNQFLYNVLVEHSKWLIKRDISNGRIYSNTFFFQPLKCQKVVEVSLTDPCCPIKTNCKIYRTKNKIPDIWIDNNGPIIKSVSSIDSPAVGTTDFQLISPNAWQSKRNDPYQKMSKQNYSFYSDGYIWFPEVNPNLVTILGFWMDDVNDLNDCDEKKECVKYLDTKFMLPPWLEAEMYSKALEQLAGVSKRLPEDEQPDKNTNRKN